MHHFYGSCIGWDRDDLDSLDNMLEENASITRRTFLKHVDRKELKQLEKDLGYDHWFPMSRDWHVSYHRSQLHGKTCYYFRWSAIEYVFTKEEDDEDK